eukprot:TRINITY_DN632_c0_g1_i2.p1 TRINITY_DN632_c0_g1~~TRINITY_DN632_c0_g1_i2.p1  ORF type:complete len:1128 (+),score=240.79 TRINITY_DN632_c0_g1_i2:61-3444(+)
MHLHARSDYAAGRLSNSTPRTLPSPRLRHHDASAAGAAAAAAAVQKSSSNFTVSVWEAHVTLAPQRLGEEVVCLDEFSFVAPHQKSMCLGGQQRLRRSSGVSTDGVREADACSQTSTQTCRPVHADSLLLMPPHRTPPDTYGRSLLRQECQGESPSSVATSIGRQGGRRDSDAASIYFPPPVPRGADVGDGTPEPTVTTPRRLTGSSLSASSKLSAALGRQAAVGEAASPLRCAGERMRAAGVASSPPRRSSASVAISGIAAQAAPAKAEPTYQSSSPRLQGLCAQISQDEADEIADAFVAALPASITASSASGCSRSTGAGKLVVGSGLSTSFLDALHDAELEQAREQRALHVETRSAGGGRDPMLELLEKRERERTPSPRRRPPASGLLLRRPAAAGVAESCVQLQLPTADLLAPPPAAASSGSSCSGILRRGEDSPRASALGARATEERRPAKKHNKISHSPAVRSGSSSPTAAASREDRQASPVKDVKTASQWLDTSQTSTAVPGSLHVQSPGGESTVTAATTAGGTATVSSSEGHGRDSSCSGGRKDSMEAADTAYTASISVQTSLQDGPQVYEPPPLCTMLREMAMAVARADRTLQSTQAETEDDAPQSPLPGGAEHGAVVVKSPEASPRRPPQPLLLADSADPVAETGVESHAPSRAASRPASRPVSPTGSVRSVRSARSVRSVHSAGFSSCSTRQPTSSEPSGYLAVPSLEAGRLVLTNKLKGIKEEGGKRPSAPSARSGYRDDEGFSAAPAGDARLSSSALAAFFAKKNDEVGRSDWESGAEHEAAVGVFSPGPSVVSLPATPSVATPLGSRRNSAVAAAAAAWAGTYCSPRQPSPRQPHYARSPSPFQQAPPVIEEDTSEAEESLLQAERRRSTRSQSSSRSSRQQQQQQQSLMEVAADMPQTLQALRRSSGQTLRSSSRGSRVEEQTESLLAEASWTFHGSAKVPHRSTGSFSGKASQSPRLQKKENQQSHVPPKPPRPPEQSARKASRSSQLSSQSEQLKDCALCGRSSCCSSDAIFCEDCSSRMDVLGAGGSSAAAKAGKEEARGSAAKSAAPLMSRPASDWDSDLDSSSSSSVGSHRGSREEVVSCVRCGSRFVSTALASGSKSGSMLCPNCR